MGVYIRTVEMPKSCRGCLEEYMFCILCDINEGLLHDDDRHPNCPLIEIVECKDCKYWTDDMSGNMWCEHAIGGLTDPTDFCSCGERRADD